MWHGIIEVEEIKHIRNGQVIWQDSNLHNLLHNQGEEYFLKILFSNLIQKPAYYYFGLDDRDVIAETDTLADLDGEPTIHGYYRQVVNSVDDWTFALSGGYWQAKSAILTFGAHGGSWGPIKNLFLTMQAEDADPNNGYLISTVYLNNPGVIVADGDSISMRMVAKLKDCTIIY
jgi:hypothetical protein